VEGVEVIHSDFWKGKKVFITGHTGFKGGWLTLWLHQMGAKVYGYSLPAPSSPSFFDAVKLSELCDHKIGDIRDYSHMKSALEASQAEIVFHMAAQPLVRRSYRDPIETYSTNVMGTVNLLEAVRNTTSVKACVIITTDKCYENNEWVWGYREDDRLGGHDPYSNSKACSELVTAAYIKSFFKDSSTTGVASARAGNVIGGGDFAEDRLIPDIYRAISEKNELRIRYPESTRPWQHVLVPLSGYLKLAEELFREPKKFTDSFNFGPLDEDCISVGSIIEKMSHHWGYHLPVILESGQKYHEAKFLKLDISKASFNLKWFPAWNVEETTEKTAKWYKSFINGEDVRFLSMSQIREFETKFKR